MERYLANAEERLAPEAHAAITREVVDDTPMAAIVRRAELPGPRLVVITARGRSGLDRWVLGSVTDRVLHTGRIPVLVVSPRSLRQLGSIAVLASPGPSSKRPPASNHRNLPPLPIDKAQGR